MPALATRMSGGASWSPVAASAWATEASSVTSTSTAMALPKEAADCLARSMSRSHRATRPPPSAIWAARESPIRRAPPVTMAVRSLNKSACIAASQILELSADSYHIEAFPHPLHCPSFPGSFMSSAPPASIDATLELLKGGDYIADRSLATVLYLALKLGRPLFCEGEAGAAQNAIAKGVAAALQHAPIRLD